MNQYVETTENSLVHTYNRFPVVLDQGEGVYLYDTEGKKYLDFAAGIAVSGLGYGNPEFTAAAERSDRSADPYLQPVLQHHLRQGGRGA